MPVTEVRKDLEALTMTLTADFAAPVDRVWQVWADPRQLERWWGPPTYPATFVEHDLVAGGKVTYFMTGPEGDQHHGWWRVVSVDPPYGLEFEDGFADATGTPQVELPVTVARVLLQTGENGGTRMVVASQFPSRDAMDQVLEMGMEEGLTQAVNQIDALLVG